MSDTHTGPERAQHAHPLPPLPRGHPRGPGYQAIPEMITGEQGAGKLASPVREETDGKGPGQGHLAGGPLHSASGLETGQRQRWDRAPGRLSGELAAAGIAPHVREPADTAFARGRKRPAKTDKTESRHLRTLPPQGRRPERWVPPPRSRECRALRGS